MKIKIWTFATWLWLLALAIVATIYAAWLLYPLEIDWLNLRDSVSLTKSELLQNFHVLMNYLTNPFSTVLNMPDFPSSSNGLKHFADVKHLFHIAQMVFLLLLTPSWRFLKNRRAEKSLFLHQKGFVLAAVLPIIIGLAGLLIGFDNFFTLFHQMLFPGDSTWLFDPAADPIILVLPETFFLHCFIVFFVLYEVLMLSMIIAGRRQFQQRLANREKNII